MCASESSLSAVKREIQFALSEIYPGNEAYSIARLVLDHFGISEQEVLLHPDRTVDQNTRAEIKKIVGELMKNRPIQYVLGETEFYDLPLKVTEKVLVPRPETEELVIKIILEQSEKKPNILDIGTGSGCIAIALARHLPGASITAMDIDKDAIAVARENASRNGVKLTFLNEDVLEESLRLPSPPFDLIVSNPPYVTEQEKELMAPNVLKYEPPRALFVPNEDPLLFYRAILHFACSHLAENGEIWVEINEAHGEATKQLFEEAGYTRTRLLQDIYQKERFIHARR